MENKKKIIIPVITILLMIIGVLGVTYAFFNYTREGPANTIAVGRIYFKHEQGNTITLENVFPISSDKAQTDTVNAKTLSISVIGDTDYDGGIEYVVTLDSVNNSKNVPINLEVSVTGNGLGTNETRDYYTNRESYTESKYKIEYNGRLDQDNHILVGYISPNTTKGTIEGINGTINIKAYVDSSKVLISDTYPEGTTTIGGVEYYNGTPTTNKIVLTTEEWNSITGTNALSFKIKVEAREGIWVEKPATPTSCFTFDTTPSYVRNPNMNINTCVSKFTEWGWNEDLQEGETLETFCNGIGTFRGITFQDALDNGLLRSKILPELETAGIIIPSGYTTIIVDYDANCGSDVVIPSKINTEIVTYARNPNMNINTCVSKFTEWGWNEDLQEGETLEAFCNGTGTVNGSTLQQNLDEFGGDSELETAGIIISNFTPVQANVITIGYNSFYNKNLTNVVIPNSVTYIGERAFSGNQLTNVTIPNSVKEIGGRAFYADDNSNSYLRIIYNYTGQAFDWNNIIRGNTNTPFETGEVSHSLRTTKIVNYVEKQNECYTYYINNGVVTITNYNIKCGNDVIIPSTIEGLPVTTIAEPILNSYYSFYEKSFTNKGLTSITIPEGITTIEEGAFWGNNLTNVTVPNSVTSSPIDSGNYCEYFDVGVNVIWKGNTYICKERHDM